MQLEKCSKRSVAFSERIARVKTFLAMTVFLTDGMKLDYLWIIVMFLSAVWAFILMAPVHSRGSTDEWMYSNATFIKICLIFIFGRKIPLTDLV